MPPGNYPRTHAGFHFDSTVFYIVCWMPAFTYYLIVNLAANIAFNQSGYYAVAETQIPRPHSVTGTNQSINQSVSRFLNWRKWCNHCKDHWLGDVTR